MSERGSAKSACATAVPSAEKRMYIAMAKKSCMYAISSRRLSGRSIKLLSIVETAWKKDRRRQSSRARSGMENENGGSFISMVRLMEPTENGVPMQIYFFTAQTSWVEYEREQSALFEHIFSIVPEFDLRLFQAPTGDDIRACIRS